MLGQPCHRGARARDRRPRVGLEFAPQVAERALEDLLEGPRAEVGDRGRPCRPPTAASMPRRSARPDTRERTRRRDTARARTASRPGRRWRGRAARIVRPAAATSASARKFAPARAPDRSARSPRRWRALRSATSAGTGSDRAAAGARRRGAGRRSIRCARLRCTMCVYSCANTRRSQSSVLPIGLLRPGPPPDLDRVVGQRRRPAVRDVALVDEDHLHAAGRPPERAIEIGGDRLGEPRQPPCQRLLALMKVDVESRRRIV